MALLWLPPRELWMDHIFPELSRVDVYMLALVDRTGHDLVLSSLRQAFNSMRRGYVPLLRLSVLYGPLSALVTLVNLWNTYSDEFATSATSAQVQALPPVLLRYTLGHEVREHIWIWLAALDDAAVDVIVANWTSREDLVYALVRAGRLEHVQRICETTPPPDTDNSGTMPSLASLLDAAIIADRLPVFEYLATNPHAAKLHPVGFLQTATDVSDDMTRAVLHRWAFSREMMVDFHAYKHQYDRLIRVIGADHALLVGKQINTHSRGAVSVATYVHGYRNIWEHQRARMPSLVS